MKKIIILTLAAALYSGILYSEKFTPDQKKIMPLLEKHMITCWNECTKSKGQKPCEKPYDELEQSMRDMLKAAAKVKITISQTDAKKSAELMDGICPQQGKLFVKDMGK